VPVKAAQLGADMITVVGHKFGAPKGVAALYIRKGVSVGQTHTIVSTTLFVDLGKTSLHTPSLSSTASVRVPW
jgi:selenocysteine lyase/cysteine desulfurase